MLSIKFAVYSQGSRIPNQGYARERGSVRAVLGGLMDEFILPVLIIAGVLGLTALVMGGWFDRKKPPRDN